MFKDKKVVVVMPAYNAAQTLQRTWDEVMAQGIVDLVVLVDDGSRDETVWTALDGFKKKFGKSGINQQRVSQIANNTDFGKIWCMFLCQIS